MGSDENDGEEEPAENGDGGDGGSCCGLLLSGASFDFGEDWEASSEVDDGEFVE